MFNKLLKGGNQAAFKEKLPPNQIQRQAEERMKSIMEDLLKMMKEKNVTIFELLDVIQNLSTVTFNQIGRLEGERVKEINDLKLKLLDYDNQQSKKSRGEEDKK